MKEIIGSILQAEEMAKQIIDDATEKSKRSAANSANENEKARVSAVLSFNVQRKKALRDAEEKAQEKYQEIISAAEKEGQDLVLLAKEKTQKIAQDIVKELVK